jgi:hypothetical protein
MTVHVWAKPGSVCKLNAAEGEWREAVFDSPEHGAWIGFPRITQSHLVITCVDYEDYSQHVELTPDVSLTPVQVPLHVDPLAVSVSSVAAVRGALWTCRAPVQWGPRPGQPSNIINIGAFDVYAEADQSTILRVYRDEHKYTHADCGPWLPGVPDQGYDGQFPTKTRSFDEFLDLLQRFWDERLIPAVFAKPDGWTIAQLRELTPYYSSPRARKLIRLFGPMGWEPSKDTPNADYVDGLKWGREVLPDALIFLHMQGDFDAPGNDADFTPASQTYIGMAEAWRRVAPHTHLYFNQVLGYVFGGSPKPSDEFVREFVKLFDRSNDGSLVARFERGTNGYPTSSAWGEGKPIRPVAAEFGSWGAYHKDYPESECLRLGDIAIQAGAYGSFDGCSVAVRKVEP